MKSCILAVGEMLEQWDYSISQEGGDARGSQQWTMGIDILLHI